MSKTSRIESTPAARSAIITALRVKGDRYGHAGIAALAHELALNLNGDKLASGIATKLVESTGYDKGTVSRVGKIVREDHKARNAALKLDVFAIESTDDTFSAAVVIGEMFKRKPSGASKGSSDGPDVLALIDGWLTEATDAQFAARVDLVAAAIARITAEREAAALEAAQTEATA